MNKPYYKILIGGRSCNGGRLTWSLPLRGKPGEWHEVTGELKRCKNGLHLTSEPTYRRQAKSTCYLAEYEGDALGPFDGEELVVRRCRLLRRVPWPELVITDPEAPPEDAAKTESPSLVLLRHIWKHEGKGMGCSWRRLNSAMQSGFALAIEHGLEFGEDDLAVISKEFNPGYWWGDLEAYYSRACGHRGHTQSHGPNPSAIKAIEKFKGRQPWIVMEDANKPRVRLAVGSRFRWFDDVGNLDPKEAHWLFVTSFDDSDEGSMVACSYTDGARSKIQRRFTITHDDVKKYHKAVAELIAKREREAAVSKSVAASEAQ